MDLDELEPRKGRPQPKNLEIMGVEELEDYILRLQAEIERVQAALDKKRGHRGSAEALFKR